MISFNNLTFSVINKISVTYVELKNLAMLLGATKIGGHPQNRAGRAQIRANHRTKMFIKCCTVKRRLEDGRKRNNRVTVP